MSFESDDDGGLNAVSRSYKANPTLERYLALRRSDPTAQIEVGVYGGIDDLFALEDELKGYGIDAHPLMTGVLDAVPEAVSELSLKLMEQIIRARQLSEGGETQLIRRGVVMPDSLINWLICVMLDAQSWNDTLELNRDFIVLIRERLGGTSYKGAVDAHQNRKNAAWVGAQLKAQGIEPSIRRVAEIMKVAPSTITRWYPDNSFRPEVERLAPLFGSNGKIKWSVRKP